MWIIVHSAVQKNILTNTKSCISDAQVWTIVYFSTVCNDIFFNLLQNKCNDINIKYNSAHHSDGAGRCHYGWTHMELIFEFWYAIFKLSLDIYHIIIGSSLLSYQLGLHSINFYLAGEWWYSYRLFISFITIITSSIVY